MPTMTSAQRATVVATAKSLHKEGCHFVNGARGDRPLDADTPLGSPQDSVVLEALSLSADQPNVQAARSWKGGRICKGRFKNVKGKILSTSDADLREYRKRLSLVAAVTPHEDLPPLMRGPSGHALTPRTVDGDIILGESCLGKRHFDCIDLVNYCYSIALKKRWQFSLEQYDKGKAGATATARKVNLREGDIVLRGTSHSAVVYKTDQGQWRVIECPGGEDGCVDSLFIESEWTKRVRVSWFRA
ncbi:MAG: hypothetical protein K0S45_3703 [Nitrospira sp.]|nr:hypothetical protein [Nitrospira sp.]